MRTHHAKNATVPFIETMQLRGEAPACATVWCDATQQSQMGSSIVRLVEEPMQKTLEAVIDTGLGTTGRSLQR